MKQIKFYFLVFTSFLIFSSTVFSTERIVFPCNLSDSPEYKWVPRYLNSVDEDTTTDEVIDFLFSVREMIVNQGYSVPLFSEIFATSLEEIRTRSGIQLDERFIEDFYEEILSKESDSPDLISFSSFEKKDKAKIFLVKKNKKGKMKISNGFAKGFCKALGGTLLCIIPHPVTWGLGTTLAASGVMNMINHADDPDGITMEELDRQLRERQRIGAENMSFSPRIGPFRQTGYPISV